MANLWPNMANSKFKLITKIKEIIMETIEKIKVNVLKNDIKNLVEEQKFLKNQRKTEKLVGERKMDFRLAAYKHRSNRENLRLMYAAYGLMRGKKFSQIENHFPEENHPLIKYLDKISKIIEKYNLIEEK